MSYYDETEILFETGSNVIIGQNNTGKSKLFDAFNWVLYDKAFRTENEDWVKTRNWGMDIVNSRAVSEAKNGDFVSTVVELNFNDQENNKYIVKRTYTVEKRKSGYDWPNGTELSLECYDNETSNLRCHYDAEASAHIAELIPDNISKYIFFQGESISKIMSLNKKSDFSTALNGLSRIEVFLKAKEKATKTRVLCEKEFNNKEESNALNELYKKQIEAKIKKLEAEKENENEVLEVNMKERDISKDVFEKKELELQKYEEIGKVLDDIKLNKESKGTLSEIRNSILKVHEREVFGLWLYAGTESLIDSFSKLYEKEKKLKRIPEPIRQEFIREMLRKHECLVCGTEAPEKSKAYKKIESILDDKSLGKEEALINGLASEADSIKERIEDIPGALIEYFDSLDDIDQRIKDNKTIHDQLEAQLANTLPAGMTKEEVAEKNIAGIKIARSKAKNDFEKFKIAILRQEAKIEKLTNDILDEKKSYKLIVEKSDHKVEAARLVLAAKIEENMNIFYEKFLNKLIEDIQDSANIYFKKMTSESASYSGSLKVDYKNKEVYPVDEDGVRLSNINQANKVSLQISFVAAIISVSSKFWNESFPFIADAPISALGGNNKLMAIKTMMDMFDQSIIILKDDINLSHSDMVKADLVRKLIRENEGVSKAYELVMAGEKGKKQHTLIREMK